MAAPEKLSQASFAGGTFDDKAPEELVKSMMRYAGSYELEHDFKRPSPRMCQGGPRASAFSAETPSRRTSSARMLYKLFQDKCVAQHLAAQSFRTYGVFPDLLPQPARQPSVPACGPRASAGAAAGVYVVVAHGVPGKQGGAP